MLLADTLDKELLIKVGKAFERGDAGILADARHQERVEVIAAVHTIEAQQYLTDYLAKMMLDRPKTERIHDALRAFQHAVDQSWVSAGRYSFDQYHGLATKALQWWKENGGRRK
jgi:hypothetical protein